MTDRETILLKCQNHPQKIYKFSTIPKILAGILADMEKPILKFMRNFRLP